MITDINTTEFINSSYELKYRNHKHPDVSSKSLNLISRSKFIDFDRKIFSDLTSNINFKRLDNIAIYTVNFRAFDEFNVYPTPKYNKEFKIKSKVKTVTKYKPKIIIS